MPRNYRRCDTTRRRIKAPRLIPLAFAVFRSSAAPKVDEQDHHEAESDNDGGPEPRDGIVAIHPFKVNGDRNRARNTQIIAGKEQGGAEFAQRASERKHGARGNAAP